jgi:hypothetical protein
MAKVSGGGNLESRLEELAEKISTANAVRVGFLEGSTYPDGTPVPMIAAIHNYGAPAAGIPPRPFFSNVVAAGRKKWGNTLVSLLKQNDYDAAKVLRLMGEGIKGEIQNSINNGSYTPLKPATARRKGFDKPLIDTGHMINSVDYEVI